MPLIQAGIKTVEWSMHYGEKRKNEILCEQLTQSVFTLKVG